MFYYPKPLALTVAFTISLLLSPASHAQHNFEPGPAPDQEDGGDLMSRGAQMILRGLLNELEPAMDEVSRSFNEILPTLDAMRPQLEEMVRLMGDVKYYAAPEILPNGDVIFRRKADAPPYRPAVPPPAPKELDL